MNTAIIITHESRFVRDVIHVCRTIKGVSELRHDSFTIAGWRFIVIPRYQLGDRVLGLRIYTAVCYDTWITKPAVALIFARMVPYNPSDITYIDEPEELRRFVVETSRAPAQGSEDKTPVSR